MFGRNYDVTDRECWQYFRSDDISNNEGQLSAFQLGWSRTNCLGNLFAIKQDSSEESSLQGTCPVVTPDHTF